MNQPSLVTVVIPTVGGSPVFRECLEALAGDREAGARIVVVADQSTPASAIPGDLIDHLITAPPNSGFAVSCNLGLAKVETELSAIVNDDAVIASDWMETLVAELIGHPQAASIQGLNIQMNQSNRIDGCGINWNDRWQPIQIDHGRDQPSVTGVTEIFGASATAAIFRHGALIEVATGGQEIFDPNLHTYYDDVDLASRLRFAGYKSLVVPTSKVQHAGGASSEAALQWRHRQIYGNRLLVLARLLGRSFWTRLPRILLADLGDFSHALGRGDTTQVTGILKGWQRAAGRLHLFAHMGAPLVSPAEIDRFRQNPSGGASGP